MQQNNQQGTSLKNVDFIAWQVKKAKQRLHKDEVNLIFSSRARLRSKTHLNS